MFFLRITNLLHNAIATRLSMHEPTLNLWTQEYIPGAYTRIWISRTTGSRGNQWITVRYLWLRLTDKQREDISTRQFSLSGIPSTLSSLRKIDSTGDTRAWRLSLSIRTVVSLLAEDNSDVHFMTNSMIIVIF